MTTINDAERWCILQTSAGRTLSLATSLTTAGIEAWTPRRTIKRPAPGVARRYVLGQTFKKVPTFEVDVPILAGFVFARADRRRDLLAIEASPFSQHPRFTVLRIGDRVPLVSDRQVDGLRAAEAEAMAAIKAERAAATREEARQLRSERGRTEKDRMKLLRREAKALAVGAAVRIEGMPALDGIKGTVIESRGTSAVIHVAGWLEMTVEAWRITPLELQSADSPATGAAA